MRRFYFLIVLVACLMACGGGGSDDGSIGTGGGTGPGIGPGTSNIDPASIVGIWRRTDQGEEAKGKEYLANNAGYLGNFNSKSFSRATPFTWSLSGDVVTEVLASVPSETRHEKITELEGKRMTQRREEDGNNRHWELQ